MSAMLGRQGSLNPEMGPKFWGDEKFAAKCMRICMFRFFQRIYRKYIFIIAFFGLVSYNDPS